MHEKRVYPLIPSDMLAMFRGGWDTSEITDELNRDIRAASLPFDEVTEAEVYNAIARAKGATFASAA